jgi:hypothetical protein
MTRLVFLVEERSMKTLLDNLLPRLIHGIDFLCIPHEGKQDLETSIPRKLRAWREPGVQFIIVRDNDGGDCHAVKKRLSQLCFEAGKKNTIIRIVCQELEAWYLGEPEALGTAYGKNSLKKIGEKSQYRNPDAIQKPSREIKKMIPEFQKISGARRMAAHLTRSGNRSRSFQVMMEGVERAMKAHLPKGTEDR